MNPSKRISWTSRPDKDLSFSWSNYCSSRSTCRFVFVTDIRQLSPSREPSTLDLKLHSQKPSAQRYLVTVRIHGYYVQFTPYYARWPLTLQVGLISGRLSMLNLMPKIASLDVLFHRSIFHMTGMDSDATLQNLL